MRSADVVLQASALCLILFYALGLDTLKARLVFEEAQMATLLKLGLLLLLARMLIKTAGRVRQRRLLSSERDGLPFSPEQHSDWV